MANKPLITFGVVAFNQERFIREAIAGAFAQTYSPLEIILSDDRSTDRTWPIMQEMAAAYKGPHQLVLNQNARNLGVGAHINRVLSLVGGELFVGAAGDDISCPTRTDQVYLAWEQSGRQASAITSHVKKIDEQGREIGSLKTRIDQKNSRFLHRARFGCWNVLGCSQVWHRRVFETFGPLLDYVVAEDRAMEFRCWALGPVVMVDDYLVRYRVHGGNISAVAEDASREEQKRGRARDLKVQYAMLRQFLADVDRIERLNLYSTQEIYFARRAIVRNLGANLMEQEYLEASLTRQLALSLRAFLSINPKTGLKWVLRSLHLR
jgi:glycosyltransferase involved in cell wall biosynthesis